MDDHTVSRGADACSGRNVVINPQVSDIPGTFIITAPQMPTVFEMTAIGKVSLFFHGDVIDPGIAKPAIQQRVVLPCIGEITFSAGVQINFNPF